MKKIDALKQIIEFNQELDPLHVKIKYKAMRQSKFAFLRATCPRFYQNLPAGSILDQAPLAWISGDLHLENFGSYRGDNRLSYFDLNDFDEACLAPCTWELLRFLSSIFIASEQLGVNEQEEMELCQSFLNAYRSQLMDGKPRWIERPQAKGLIKELLKTIKNRSRKKFLDTRTKLKGGRRFLLVNEEKALFTPPDEREQVRNHLELFAQKQKDPAFYHVLDIADRISGMGSLGVKRYVVLVSGRGTPDENFLIDIKEARPSSPARLLSPPQIPWINDAERVVTLQRTLQAIPPALLTSLRIGERSFGLKELQPIEHRVNLELWDGKLKRLGTVISSMGEMVAWSQLRGAGWRGSASRDALMGFAQDLPRNHGLIELARQRSRLITQYWQEYCAGYDAGVINGMGPSGNR
jgi:uncharacterized protein (DUF2252 family)